MTETVEARQGEVRYADLDPVEGREQAGRRPVLVISVDELGTGSSGMAIVVPLTRTDRKIKLHVAIDPPEGGVTDRSFAMPEQVRSISRTRLKQRLGGVHDGTLARVLQRVHLLTRPPR